MFLIKLYHKNQILSIKTFSLKDSDGKTLSAEQQEYFKDSKVRDEDGNLLVVYHGSPAKFTVFDHKYLNSHGNSHGRGFYFTEKKSPAKVKRYIDTAKMSPEDRAKAKARFNELKLFENAFKAAENVVEQKISITNSDKNLEIKKNKEYNGNVNHSLKSVSEDEYSTDGTK